ncbi:MAG: sel1 repeat family protein [Lentisphaerae bacterium]|nr:sel1 repeat family protein [Lentisphaerota bacterium]
MSQHARKNKKAPPAASTVLDRLIRWLVIAVMVTVAGWGLSRVPWPIRPTSDPSMNPADGDHAKIIAAERELAALAALKPLPAPPADLMPLSAGDASLTRSALEKAATQVRLVASEARDELKNLGLSESEDAGLVSADWLAGETAFSLGSWEEAEQAYYRIVNRIRKLRAVVRMARDLDVSEQALTADLAANRELLRTFGGERLREVVALATQARGQSAGDPIARAKLYQEALIKLPQAVGEARQAERREKIGTLLQLAGRAAERGDWVAAAAASASILKYDPENARASALRAQAVKGLDALIDRYVALQHEPGRTPERTAGAAQIRRGARDGDPLCQIALLLYSRDDPALKETPDTLARCRAEGWSGLLQRARRGSRTAAFLAARCYEDGIGVDRDMTEALRWYRDAADQGSVQAQNNLAWIHHQGFGGVPQDIAEALTWYRRAAEQGSIPAQCSLAGLLLADENSADAEAAEWYRRAAEKGSALAQCNLALLLMTGRGVPRDESQASALFRSAALQKDPLAQFNLGYLHMTGKGVPQDDAEAVRWYRLAAEQGFATAQRNLGGMLAVGRGVPRNDAEAAKWYTRAAEQGDAGAQCNIGWMCAHGVGVDQDLVKAVTWYRRAAERGNPEALFMLGVMTVQGAGTARDETQGRRWIAEAAARGLDQARAWLELAARPRVSETLP